MESLYNSALSGITKLMGKRIDVYTEEKETVISSLEEQKKAAEDAYQAQIDALEEKKKANQEAIDNIQDEIDAINDAADARKRELDLQKAKYELERMQNQRTKLIYSEEKGMHYVADTSGIRDARENVADAEREIKIAELERQKKYYEDINDEIDKQIDALNDLIDKSNEYYDSQISSMEKYYDSLIKSMEQQKSKWEELADIKDIANAYSAVQQVVGEMGYTVEDILNGNEAAFEDFKSKYISIMSDLNSNSSFADGLTYATGVAKENFGTILDSTNDVAESFDNLGEKSTAVDDVATSMGNASTSASELKGSTDGLSDNISEISDSLNEFPSSDKISDLTQPFNDLADAIEEVANALGINGEGSVNGLVTALKELGNISLGDENTGLVAQFNNLASAVTAVSSAINGTGGASSDPQDSSSPSMSTGSTGTGSSITSALDELKQKSDTVLGSVTEEGTDGSGDGVIGQFGKLKTGVDDVNTSISGGGSGEGNGKSDKSKDQGSDGDTSNLIGSITELGNTTSEVMGGAGENGENNGEGVIGKFQEFTNVVDEANNYFTEMLSTLEELSSQEWEIKVTVSGNGAMLFESNAAFVGGGNGIKPHYKGTVGKAFAKGYPGLLHNEKNALRSEYGQQELTVYPDGTWELTDKPTIDDLPKDTVIFNEEQTKKILNNKGQIGNAHAKGTSEQTALEKLLAKHGYEGAIVEEYHLTDMNGNVVTQQTFDKMAETFTSGIYDAVTPLQDFAEKVQKTVKIIEGSNIVNNNQQQPINQTINVTLPNVTDRTSATELLRDLESLSTKKLQYNWKK